MAVGLHYNGGWRQEADVEEHNVQRLRVSENKRFLVCDQAHRAGCDVITSVRQVSVTSQAQW